MGVLGNRVRNIKGRATTSDLTVYENIGKRIPNKRPNRNITLSDLHGKKRLSN